MLLKTLDDLRNMSLEEFLQHVLETGDAITVRVSENQEVQVQPLPQSEQVYWQRLQAEGLVLQKKSPPPQADSFEPIAVQGEPLSQTIIRERR
jgi:hypothetical protein